MSATKKHRFDPETFTPSDLGFTDEEAQEFLDGCNFLFSHDEDEEPEPENRPPLAKLDKNHAHGPLAQ